MTEAHRPDRSTAARALRAFIVIAGFLFAGVLAAPTPAHATEPQFLTFSGGLFDISGNKGSGIFNLEFVDSRKWVWNFKPMSGASVTTDGALYGYAGLALDMYFGRSFVVDFSFAPGLYFKGGGKDLGNAIEFRSALKAAYKFGDRSRLGLELSHMSNAGLSNHNPGANQLMMFYSIPFQR